MSEDLTLVNKTIVDLQNMVEQSIKHQTAVSPIFRGLSEKILNIFEAEGELDNMEVKELLKLLELSNKATVQPIEQLTKLVQSITALHESSTLRGKVDQLSEMVNKIEKAREEAETSVEEPTESEIEKFEPNDKEEIQEAEYIDIEEIE